MVNTTTSSDLKKQTKKPRILRIYFTLESGLKEGLHRTGNDYDRGMHQVLRGIFASRYGIDDGIVVNSDHHFYIPDDYDITKDERKQTGMNAPSQVAIELFNEAKENNVKIGDLAESIVKDAMGFPPLESCAHLFS